MSSDDSSNVWLRKAVASFSKCEFATSAAYFCIAFKTDPENEDIKNEWKATFLFAIDKHIQNLEQADDVEAIVAAFQEAIESYPSCEDLHYNFANFYFKHSHLSKAVSHFCIALELNSDFHSAHLALENIKASSLARWHFIMINDVKRNLAFREAIKKIVSRCKAEVVLDIGAGSGLLSLYAMQAGVKQIYACEVSEMLYFMCKDVLEVNEIADKVILLNDMSTNISVPKSIPQKAQMLVTEIFDAALFGEKALTTISHALKNLLQPDSVVLPAKAVLYGAFIESEEIRKTFSFSSPSYGKLRFKQDVAFSVDVKEMKYTTEELSKLKSLRYLTETFVVVEVNFSDLKQLEKLLDKSFEMKFSIPFIESGTVDALAVWFDLILTEDIIISTRPPSQLIGWEQAIYPTNCRHSDVSLKDEIEFSVKFNEDYMQLTSINIKNNAKTNCLQRIPLKPEIVRYLNAQALHELMFAEIEKLSSALKNINILDMTFFPVTTFHCSHLSNVAKIVHVIHDDEFRKDISSFVSNTNSKPKKISYFQYEELLANNQCDNLFNVVLTDFIEPTGLIRNNLLEQFTYMKLVKCKMPNLVFMPYSIKVFGMLVESEDIIKKSRLINDENVDGFKIAQFLNIFETEVLQDVDLSKLSTINLSEPFLLLEIKLNERLSPEKVCTEPKYKSYVETVKEGKIHAIIYWYELLLAENVSISTLRMSHNWHQAAFIMKRVVDCHDGDLFKVDTTFCNGFLRINVVKVSTNHKQ